MARYGRDGIAQLMEEEAGSPAVAQHDSASVVSSSTFSSVKSEDAASIFDGASIRTFSSDTSSVTGSIISNISNVSARTAKLLGRGSKSSAASIKSATSIKSSSTQREDDAASIMTTSDATSASTPAPKQKGSFTCGFCREEDIQKTCTRKNDLKRHIEDFHNMNAQWFCRHRGCTMVFDWQTAYKTHLKHAHSGSRMTLDEAKVNLCPQTVFACGFENCNSVFEAPSDDDADSTFKEYVSHVVKHFDEGAPTSEWTYSARMRNLLRQGGLVNAWAASSWPEPERNRLQWFPQSSSILRKRLETRHLNDVALLIQYAIALGSEPESINGYREDFITPVKDECRQPIPGHKSRAPPLPPSAPAPDPDQYQFRISRATNPNLAAYMASQRRVYVPRPGPVRAGRSARPPRHTMPANAANQGSIPPQFRYQNMPQAPMFDPRQQHQQQQFAMMQQSNGGIIAEDLRSLRSMASSNPEQDIDMTDSDMMDAAYMQDQAFSGPYGQGGIPSPAPDGACVTTGAPMDNHMYTYDSAAY